MPNWCNNSLYVKGNELDIEKFYEENLIANQNEIRNTDLELDFSKVVPEPVFDNPKEQDEYDGGGWYEWRIENWGTKWQPDTIYYDYKKGDKSITIEFDTAWSPPITWLEKAISKYPNLYFNMSYHEDGMSFRGEAESINGFIDNRCWDMTYDDLEELGYETNDESEDEQVNSLEERKQTNENISS
jgi:hypothetical protein